jgi:F-type H+-transporting ATPase subunit alpha
VIWSGTKGFIDDVPLENVKRFEQGLLAFVQNAHSDLLEKIRDRKALDKELEDEMRGVVTEFKERFLAEQGEAASSRAAD